MSSLSAGKTDPRIAAALARISGKQVSGKKKDESQQVATIRAARPTETNTEVKNRARS